MIPQSTIDRIVDAANIVDVVSDYVTLRRAGASYKGLCPFHDDKTPSFSVSPARGVCKCFSCGKGGNAVHFIMEMEQMSYVEALKHLAKKYSIPVEEEEMTDEQRQKMNERESMFAVNEWAAKYFSQTMMNNQDGRAVGLAYFRSRGFRDDIIAKFRLGFCLDSPDAMSKEAKAKGYNEKYLVDTGLCVKRDNGTIYDRFRGRAMFPWIAVNGRVVAFGGRVLDARTKGVNQKYVNSPDSLIYHKANELYGIFQAKKQIAKEDMVYMVEGYTDVLAMHQCGIENVVANSGTALNEAQIHLLHRFTNNITLLYDGDEAGIHAATRSTDMLLAEGMNVKILLLPDGDDPDSYSRKHNAQEFKEYVAAHQTDFILFKTNLLLKDAQRDPIKRAQLTEDIVKSIAVIPDEIIRSTYVHECAEILNMDEAILMRGANKNRAAILENLRKEAQRERERQMRLLNQGAETTEGGNSSAGPATTSSTSASTADASTADASAANASASEDDPFAGLTPVDDTTQQLAPEENQVDIQSVITKQSQSEQRFLGLERLLMTLVTRYGEQLVEGQDENGEPKQMSLAEYVEGDLSYDDITLRSPLYAKMLALTCQHVHDEDFVASKYLVNNQDEDVSREAADLISDRYQLSKGNQMSQSEEERIVPNLSRILLDYKNAIVEEDLKQCNADLTRPEVKADITQTLAIIQRIKELGELQRQLAKLLGDRVVVK
ncbi:MAG: DNA primase [Bacteroidaceae bacterium]|nr:DNA primase [Bacteroidaceae bacterium]